MARLILVLLMLLLSGMAPAEIYKWVDAQGVVHFQDHPKGVPEKFSTEEKAGQAKQATHIIKQSHKTQKSPKTAGKSGKQDKQCKKLRDQANKLEARMKHYSQFKDERATSYLRQQKQLIQDRQYLDRNCN